MLLLHSKLVRVDLVVGLDELRKLQRRAMVRATVLMENRKLLYKLLRVINIVPLRHLEAT